MNIHDIASAKARDHKEFFYDQVRNTVDIDELSTTFC